MYTSEPDNIKNRENDVFPSLECSRKKLKQQKRFLAENYSKGLLVYQCRAVRYFLQKGCLILIN